MKNGFVKNSTLICLPADGITASRSRNCSARSLLATLEGSKTPEQDCMSRQQWQILCDRTSTAAGALCAGSSAVLWHRLRAA